MEEGGRLRGGEGAGWWKESSERTEMERIKMEEKTIAMEGEKGRRERRRRRRGEEMGKGSKGFTRGGRECLFPWSQMAQMAS